MSDVHFIEHKHLTQDLLDEIIRVKSVAWPYSYDEQCKWIKNNLKDSDIHVLLYDKDSLTAYLNLVEIDIEFDAVTYKGFGIGNVCAAEKGKGFGKVLIDKANSYLVENNKVGLLFCKDQLIPFYTQCKWILVTGKEILISDINSHVNTFVYNAPEDFKQIKYQGIAF